jgi:hypothetical protein
MADSWRLRIVGLAATTAFPLRFGCFFVLLMVAPKGEKRTFSNLRVSNLLGST